MNKVTFDGEDYFITNKLPWESADDYLLTVMKHNLIRWTIIHGTKHRCRVIDYISFEIMKNKAIEEFGSYFFVIPVNIGELTWFINEIECTKDNRVEDEKN